MLSAIEGSVQWDQPAVERGDRSFTAFNSISFPSFKCQFLALRSASPPDLGWLGLCRSGNDGGPLDGGDGGLNSRACLRILMVEQGEVRKSARLFRKSGSVSSEKVNC